jgi:tetratricopeptide (TPR) repeat protein
MRDSLLPSAFRRPAGRSLGVGLGAGLTLAAILCCPATVQADEALDAAKKRYEVGQRDYNAGRFWQSAKAFEEAYALSKRGDLLFNAARAYDRGEYAVRAIEAYQAYIDAVPEAPDKAEIQKRLTELRATLAKLQINISDSGFLFIDGHEYGRTPMQQPIDMDSGYHRIEVRKDNRLWAKEQQFSAGQTYKFDAELSMSTSGRGLADTTTGEEQRPKARTFRRAAVVSPGVAVDVAGNAFPPLQVALALGFDYRAIEKAFFAFDVALRVPIEFLNGWRNAGFLIGGRAAISPLPRRPLEFVFELDLGLGVLDYATNFPPAKGPCQGGAGALTNCTLYGLRLHPQLQVAYRVTPHFELRVTPIGVEVNFTNPIVDPRLTFGASAVYRF